MSLIRSAIPLCRRFQTVRAVAARLSSDFPPSHHPPHNVPVPSMNELPIPQGSWQAYYDSKQTKYNAQLAIGVIAFIISATAWWKIIFPDTWFFVPELPEDEK